MNLTLARWARNLLAGAIIVFAGWFLPTTVWAIDSAVQWKDPPTVRLEVDFPGNDYHAKWQLYRCRCGDLLIRSELNVPGEVVHGDILLVGSRAVLMHGYEPDAAEQVSIDAPALMLQLALRLLERAEPSGPAAITGVREVSLTDEINYIYLDTVAASGGFPAPWSVEGKISPRGENERQFDLRFRFTAPIPGSVETQQAEMRLNGVANFAEQQFPVTGDTDIRAWGISWREADDPVEDQQRPSTLDELRALLNSNPLK